MRGPLLILLSSFGACADTSVHVAAPQADALIDVTACNLPPVSMIDGGNSHCRMLDDGAMLCRYELRTLCAEGDGPEGSLKMLQLNMARRACHAEWRIWGLTCE